MLLWRYFDAPLSLPLSVVIILQRGLPEGALSVYEGSLQVARTSGCPGWFGRFPQCLSVVPLVLGPGFRIHGFSEIRSCNI